MIGQHVVKGSVLPQYDRIGLDSSEWPTPQRRQKKKRWWTIGWVFGCFVWRAFDDGVFGGF